MCEYFCKPNQTKKNPTDLLKFQSWGIDRVSKDLAKKKKNYIYESQKGQPVFFSDITKEILQYLLLY